MSDSIYQNKPYTYLIKFIPTGQVYYGVRTSNKVVPEDDLWKRYFTSSKYVKKLIYEYGPEWFEYEIRQVFESVDKARDWEERVLKRMNVVKSDNWLNRSDNKCILQNEDTKQKQRQVFIKKYGVENPFQSEKIKEKIKKTNLNKYGTAIPLQSEEVLEKLKKTCNEKYNNDYYLQSNQFKEYMKQYNLYNYGVDHYSKTDDFKKKFKNTNNERYGVNCYTQTEEYKKKTKETCLKKYGVENPAQSEIARQKIRQKYQCGECEFISNKGNVVKHQNKTGHKNFYKVEEEV